MKQGRNFGQALEKLYRCGTSPTQSDQEEFLSGIGDLFDCHITTLHFRDSGHHAVSVNASAGFPAKDMDSLLLQAGGRHLWFEKASPTLQIDGVIDDQGLVPDRELTTSDFFRGCLDPMEIRHGMALGLGGGSPEQFVALTVNRDRRRGAFNAEEHQRAHQLLPHLRNVYGLQQRLSWLEAQLAAFRTALDRLAFGALLLNRHGGIVFWNLEAQRQCAQKQGLLERARKPHAVWPSDEAPLRKLLESACSGVVLSAPGTLLLHDGTGNPVASTTVVPVPQVTALGWSETNVTAVMFVHALRPLISDARTALINLFGLTGAEADLACALRDGITLSQASDRLSKSVNTLRSQLRVLFAKTGTRRQTELLLLLQRV